MMMFKLTWKTDVDHNTFCIRMPQFTRQYKNKDTFKKDWWVDVIVPHLLGMWLTTAEGRRQEWQAQWRSGQEIAVGDHWEVTTRQPIWWCEPTHWCHAGLQPSFIGLVRSAVLFAVHLLRQSDGGKSTSVYEWHDAWHHRSHSSAAAAVSSAAPAAP